MDINGLGADVTVPHGECKDQEGEGRVSEDVSETDTNRSGSFNDDDYEPSLVDKEDLSSHESKVDGSLMESETSEYETKNSSGDDDGSTGTQEATTRKGQTKAGCTDEISRLSLKERSHDKPEESKLEQCNNLQEHMQEPSRQEYVLNEIGSCVNNRTCDKMAKLLRENLDDLWLLRKCLEAVETMCSQHKSKREKTVDYATLKATAGRYSRFMRLCYDLALESSNVAIEKKDKLILRVACRIFVLLSSDPFTRIYSSALEKLPRILAHAVESYPSDRIIQRQGFKAVLNISCDDDVREEFHNLAVLSSAHYALINTSVNNDRFTVEAALAVIANLTRPISQDKGKAIEPEPLNAQLVNAIQSSMTNYSHVISLQGLALNALGNVMHDKSDSEDWDKETFVECLLYSLREYSETQTIQQHGLRTLINGLKIGGPNLRQAFNDRGTNRTVKRAAWNFDVDLAILRLCEQSYSLLREG
mmetsp:Transcript_20508/g.33415  ORF Transcript_20508/g.33415 Transcript_20508/m.33415 type:complete len:476 (-) Transcript_20508:851-2278(-)